MKCYVLIFDVTGIQKYVFGSNKLMENLGASYIVTSLFNNYMKEALKQIGLSTNHFDDWILGKKVLKEDPALVYEVLYVGGGNLLIIFNNESACKKLIKTFTKNLLLVAPSLAVATACIEAEYDSFYNNYSEYSKLLFDRITESKNNQAPITTFHNYGITALCPRSGYSADKYYGKDKKFISSVSYRKIEMAESANKIVLTEFSDILGDKYCFTNDLEKLGQSKNEDSHIAVVHIDGNDMGKRFQNVKSVDDLRILSLKVEEITKKSFRYLLKHIVDNIDLIKEALNRDDLPAKDGKEILPLRPIIIGGDDITFVSDGRLGIYFAKIFMEKFEELGKAFSKDNDEGLTSCGGIAIAKTKYPFYRVYRLSEELCSNAKNYKKKNGLKGSFLDFHISHQGISNSLDCLRDFYKCKDGSLIFRPYQINSEGERGLNRLIKNAKIFSSLSRSKVKELRECLTLGKIETKEFIIRNRGKNFILSEFEKNYKEEIFINGYTPYFDIIEFMELYPLNIS